MFRPDSTIGATQAWHAALTVVVSLLASACGARTSLDDATAAQGGGGAGGGDAVTVASSATLAAGQTTATASTTGVGGAPPEIACDFLVDDGPPIAAASPLAAEHWETDPAIVAIDADRAMVFATRVDPIAEAVDLWSATFEPWGAWPADLGSGTQASSGLRPGFLATPGEGPHASVVLPVFSLGVPGASLPLLASVVEPDKQLEDGAFLFGLSGPIASRPSSFASSAGRYLVGWEAGDSGATRFIALSVATPDGTTTPAVAAACGANALTSSATVSGSGFLFAAGTALPFEACRAAQDAPGASRLAVLEVTAEGVAEERYVEEMSEPLVRVVLTDRGEGRGAWLLTQTDGSTSLRSPGVRALALDASGRVDPSIEPVVVAPEGTVSFGYAAASYGAGFAVAWIDALDPSAPTIAVRLFDARGEFKSAGSVPTSGFWWTGGRLAITSDPDSGHVLVGWGARDPEPRVVVARLQCEVDNR